MDNNDNNNDNNNNNGNNENNNAENDNNNKTPKKNIKPNKTPKKNIKPNDNSDVETNNKTSKKNIKEKNNDNDNDNINLNNINNNTNTLSTNENFKLNDSNNNISHLVSNNENTSNNGSSNNTSSNRNNNIKNGNNINEDTKKFIDNVSNKIKDTRTRYLLLKEKWDDTSLSIKILNISLSILLTYYFVYINYILPLSIIFFIISFFTIFIFNKLFAFIYLAIYIIIMVEINNSKNIAYGNPFKVTDLNKTKTPLDCTKSLKLTIDSKEFKKESQTGNTTYSFWIYVNGSNNTVSQNTWNTYRYKEWKSIMYRGDSSSQTQFPGFWLTPTLNNLVIAFQNNASKVERIQLDNIEMNKWINIITVIENKSVSIYIDGLLDRINNLDEIQPDVSSYNLYINNDYIPIIPEDENNINSSTSTSINKYGFPGYLTNVINYNYPLTANYIKEAYTYYKNIIDNYQIKIDNKNNTYSIPSLITNSDIKN
jgi:hypothetical protein